MKTLGIKCFATLLTLLLSSILLTMCDPMYKMTKCPSYVVCYVNLESIKVSAEPSGNNCLLIEHGNDLPVISYGLNSTGDNKVEYDRLCTKHHDTSYNQYRSLSSGPAIDFDSVTYNECDFTGITVTSNKDFDETHVAGKNLSDIVRFMSWSPNKYILSGYSKYYHYDKSDVSETFDSMMRIYIESKFFDHSTDAECYPVDNLIKDLTAEDLTLIGHDAPGFLGMLYFEKLPCVKGEYEITVSIKTDNDKVLSDKIKMEF